MSKILVLMSTYNGEQYLEKQIDSVFSQKNVELKLCIRDDGSTDMTIPIIEAFIINNPNVNFYTGENLKPAKSFMWLVHNCDIEESEYFAFCDQDDVWIDNKLEVAINRLKVVDDKPALYYCATKNVDKNLKKIDILFTNPKHTSSLMDSIATGSLIPGCTMVFNRKLMILLRKHKPEHLTMHDTWTHLVCLSCGGIVFADNNPHILYRQHEGNFLGSKQKSIIERFNRLLNLKTSYSEMICEIFSNYYIFLSKESKIILASYVDYSSNIKKKLVIFRNTLKSNLSVTDKFLHLIKIILNKF